MALVGVPARRTPRRGPRRSLGWRCDLNRRFPAGMMKGNPRTVLIVAILASFVAFLDGSIVNVALPAITRELGGGIETQQWVVDAYLLTLGSLILVAGSISDTFGRVGVLRAGLIIFGAASVACAIAPTSLVLIIARAVQGAGAALLVPSSLAIITATLAGAARAKAMGASPPRQGSRSCSDRSSAASSSTRSAGAGCSRSTCCRSP